MTANLNSGSINSLETEEELLRSPESEAESASPFHHETFLYHSTYDAPAEPAPDFASDESGVGTIETVLILVVLISLVIIFQTQIKQILNNIFRTINSGVNEVKVK